MLDCSLGPQILCRYEGVSRSSSGLAAWRSGTCSIPDKTHLCVNLYLLYVSPDLESETVKQPPTRTDSPGSTPICPGHPGFPQP